MSFNNKVVLVTGGSGGIGASIAESFSKEDAYVVIVGRNEANLNKVAETCGSKAFIIKADVSIDSDNKVIIEQTIGKFGKLDILVNNAGIVRAGELLKGTALTAFDDIMRTNLRAAVCLTELAAPHLVKTKGNVINISSILASRVIGRRFDMTEYGMSKIAMNYFTRGAAIEMGPHGVRVNSVSPGPTRTHIFDTAGMASDWDEWGKKTTLGKPSDAKEIADMVLYVASDKAKSVTGSEFIIDNGVALNI